MACACLASLSLPIPFSSSLDVALKGGSFPRTLSVQACPIHRHPCPNLIESLKWTRHHCPLCQINSPPLGAKQRETLYLQQQLTVSHQMIMTLYRLCLLQTRLVSCFLNHARLRKNSSPSTPFPFSARNFEPWQ
ncbi:hypothetical protein BKA60DRAFT_555281 [Fusarium oxysporum]|nr:hypothetical protein BKA60DRAFT_555281 [Fusarium oxysporum]